MDNCNIGENYYLDKNNLVEYIIGKHEEIKKRKISPIKLQKTLYLLYAMWSGNANNINKHIQKENNEVEVNSELKVDLFTPEFEAWMYGPVDREVYHKFKNNQYKPSNDLLIKDNEYSSTVVSFVDDILEQTFDISDFVLVDITHEDKCWKKIYLKDPQGNTKIPKNDIIIEYSKRLDMNESINS